MRGWQRLLASVTALVAAVSFTPMTPAVAAVQIVNDRVRDTNAPNDVTRIKVDNAPNRLLIGVRYRNLGPGHISARVQIDTGRRGGEYYIFYRAQDFNGNWVTPLFRRVPGRPNYVKVRCPAKHVAYQAGDNSRIIFRLPQRCLGADAGRAWFHYFGAEHEGTGPPRPEVAPARAFLVRQN